MIVLASASPRRRALLAEAGLVFTVRPSEADERLPPGTDPVEGARVLAERKARAVVDEGTPAWVVGADTVVAVAAGDGGERLLGKPTGPGEADGMLATLSGSRHRVVTGVCVLHAGRAAVASETTWVTMRSLTDPEREAYVASGEWRDKAGGYAIQETADRFVTRLEGGGFDNVVGLPVALTLGLLRAAGEPQAAALAARSGGG